MPIILKRKIFYSYWDVNGDGINPEDLQSYSSSVIFDSYNRAIYAYGEVYGNHQLGSYHGEIFNDYERNNAYGDYSSAAGSNVTSYNAYEHGFGHFNESKPGETVFTVGTGTDEDNRHNAFEIHNDNSSYVNGCLYAETSYVETSYVTGSSYAETSYVNGCSYTKTSYTADISYSYNAYISYQAHINDNLWVHGKDVNKQLNHMVKMFPLPDADNRFHKGVHYIWLGTAEDLPEETDRYANVFYVVCDETPDKSKIFNEDDNLQ